MNLNFSDFSPTQIYHLMTQTIIPRPIAWVMTDSGEANYNLAPFSYFTAVSSNPPLMMFSVGKKPSGEVKDTVKNIIETRQCVIHIASKDDANLVTQTAATLAHGESEVAINNIALSDFEGFAMPRVAGCNIAYGCELYEIKEIGDVPQTLVFVEIKTLYIGDDVVSLDAKNRVKVNADKVNPLARLGGGEYSGITSAFGIERPE
ncbi:flavin reductase family protein [Pseudoalteromonas sp. G4]|uniref:flavin reductase family protein n=1 Tax=Pseudoalteromonas sp. G4 TaxID=2992761 RepID=UPI00237D6258|nr:flavin reductase family protein [Pseudoalteromonas sp. G4]MDE3273462.1 flavin reductase family protein [Pseudoalteromonas sp. G4]